MRRPQGTRAEAYRGLISRFGRLFSALVVALIALWSSPASAQGTANVTCRMSATSVGKFDSFTIQMDALVENGAMPNSPSLRPPPGISVGNPSVSTRTMARMGGGSMFIERGIGVTWALRATNEGTFTIPAPTVNIAGRRVAAKCQLRLTVGPSGSPSSGPNDPLLGPLDDSDLSSRGQRLALDEAPDRYAFVRIVADKSDVVVGEQVTLSFYFYRFARYHQVGLPREPPLTDFLRFPLERAPGVGSSVTTHAGGRVFEARLLDKMAVFPVRAGKLQTGSMKLDFTARSFGNRLQSRLSNDLAITVREPPEQGRPVGYRLGDTGRYDLSAKVTPRRAKVGDSVAVEVTLRGVGALPGSLKLPERTGVEWLTPEKHEDMSVQSGKIGGMRTFRYAVRMNRPGEVDLGAVALPHYDPEARQYRDTRAELGVIQVAPAAGKTAAQAPDGGVAVDSGDDDDAFASVAGARPQLRVYQGTGERGFAPFWLWSLVAAPPLLVLAGGAMWRGAGGLQNLRKRRAEDPAVLARQTLRELNAKGDAKDNAAVVERALHHAIEAGAGIKSRGVLLDELPALLTGAGIAAQLADDTALLLADSAALRFEPDADAGKANALPKRARQLIKQLLKGAKG